MTITRRGAIAAAAAAAALPAIGTGTAFASGGDAEAEAASLLDEALLAYWEFSDVEEEHWLSDRALCERLQQRAQRLEDAAGRRLLGLDADDPAVWLAQVAYVTLQGHDTMFADGRILDFERALDEDGFNGIMFAWLGRQIVARLKACTSSPVAAVIAKHREIDQRRHAEWLAGAAEREAEERKRAAEAQAREKEIEAEKIARRQERMGSFMREMVRLSDQMHAEGWVLHANGTWGPPA